MSEAERERMRDRLDEFARRLDARAREFEDHGEFSDLDPSLTGQIRERQARIETKLASAQAHGMTWDKIKIQFERDFSSIFDDLSRFDEKLDAEQMKAKKE